MDMCVVSHQGVVGQRWADVDDELNEAKLSRLKNKSQHFPLYILLSPKIWIYWRQKFPRANGQAQIELLIKYILYDLSVILFH